MRVLLKLNQRTAAVDNISVDDKCYPLVGGVHPYSEGGGQAEDSPLTNKPAVWFKTLALDAVYIDCNRRHIFWTPVEQMVEAEGVDGVQMRRKSSACSDMPRGVPDLEFVSNSARPLVDDSSLYDFDPSYNEMMNKCFDLTDRYFRKSLSGSAFRAALAMLLHVYILPSVNFRLEDVYSLTRCQSLIEERMAKAEQTIMVHAQSLDMLTKCLTTLKGNILHRERVDSEKYLEKCDREFLNVFLHKVEEDVQNVNFQLEAEQSKVNWAKGHNESKAKLKQLAHRRNELFSEVQPLIAAREAIKNVIQRRNLSKTRKKKVGVVANCFHSVFVELVRRIKGEETSLGTVVSVKVNIVGAREATIKAIRDLDNNNRNSERTTRFEPDDFVDYHLNGRTLVEKSDSWLSFDERVGRVMASPHSNAAKIHTQGCENLRRKVDMALSEFHLSVGIVEGKDADTCADTPSGSADSQSSPDTVSVLLRPKNLSVVDRERRSGSVFDQKSIVSPEDAVVNNVDSSSSDHSSCNDSQPPLVEAAAETSLPPPAEGTDEEKGAPGGDLGRASVHSTPALNFADDHFIESASGQEEKILRPLHRDRGRGNVATTTTGSYTPQAALSRSYDILMKDIEKLKGEIKMHFREVTESLGAELEGTTPFPGRENEQREQLWRTYEKFFCEEMLSDLLALYAEALAPCSQEAYRALSSMSLFSLIGADKMLDALFGEGSSSAMACQNVPAPEGEDCERISMARTLSCLSVDMKHCSIGDLYSLANADSNDLTRRFNLDKSADGISSSSSSSESGVGSRVSDPRDDETIAGFSDSLEKSSNLSKRLSASCSNIRLDVEAGDAEYSASPPRRESHSSENLAAGVRSPEVVESPERTSQRDKGVQFLDTFLGLFRKQIKKCLDSNGFLDKVRYITRAVEEMNWHMSQVYGPDHQSVCDDIITMLVLALSNMPEDLFIGLFVNLRLLVDVLPPFLNGTLWDYNLVCLYASYDFLFSKKVCESVDRKYPGSIKVKLSV
ncbi:uncharacterized protein LOC101851164 [Aplysia californica]|uniref:Uncharacterized protein LOC101851164 n=1 Tax=Aplysia californica TaxID=6500 RepID=A0ABM0JC58_APLCA|nr:uncharacterized protein LOC101851164 [Aplysia californica]